MRTVLVTPATFRWTEVNDNLRVRSEIRIDGTDSDVQLMDSIMSVAEAYQQFTNNVLCLSTWDLYLDGFPQNPKRIDTLGPLSSITSITYLDSAGTSQTLATAYYTVDSTDPAGGRITLKSGQSWPSTLSQADAVIVRIIAGWANPNAIPQQVKDGMILKIQEIYDGIDRSRAYEACWARYRRIPI